MHQQGGCESPVTRCTSIAHTLAAPQSGQRAGSMKGASGMVAFSCSHAGLWDQPGSSTLLTTWITPFDWYTLAMVTIAVPPLASVT